MTNTEATIDLFEEIPYRVIATYKDTGKPIPGATINNLKWVSSQPIGEFLPSRDANSTIFKPAKAGTTQISANAVVGNIVLI